MSLRVRRLEAADDRSSFSSGNEDLDRFFHRYAGQNQFRHHLGTTYLAVDAHELIAGFVTVTASELTPAVLPPQRRKKLPAYPVPVLRVARLAVDARFRGQGVGALLLRSALALALELQQRVGCLGVVVDAKRDAVAFYAKLGFVRLDAVAGHLGDRPEPTPMFLELAG